MFPHFFGFDVSAALPWTVGGFLLGVLLTALWRGLGSSRAGSSQLQTALFDLSALRSVRDEHETFTNKLQSDFGFLETALADAERRAAATQALTRANADLGKAEAESRAGWMAAAVELASMKTALQTQTSRNTTLEQRLQFIMAENTAAGAASETRAREMEKLRADLSAAANALQDVPKLKREYSAAASEIEALRVELERRGQPSAVSKYDYDTAMKDLVATRNLTIKQAEDVKALSARCAKLEAERTAKASSLGRALGFAGRTQALKTRRRNAFRKANGQGGSGKRAVAKGKSGGNGALSGRSTPSAAPGTFYFGKASKWRGAASQRGVGRVWAVTGRGALVNGLNGAANSSADGDDTGVAMLKARVASLSDELENYRRLRDAVVAANRIAEGEL